MGLCVGMIRGGRANGIPCIPSTMDNGLVPGPGPFRALVSGPLTGKGASGLARDWACDLTCDCLRKPDSDPKSRDWSGDVPTVTCWERFLLRRSVRNTAFADPHKKTRGGESTQHLLHLCQPAQNVLKFERNETKGRLC